MIQGARERDSRTAALAGKVQHAQRSVARGVDMLEAWTNG